MTLRKYHAKDFTDKSNLIVERVLVGQGFRKVFTEMLNGRNCAFVRNEFLKTYDWLHNEVVFNVCDYHNGDRRLDIYSRKIRMNRKYALNRHKRSRKQREKAKINNGK